MLADQCGLEPGTFVWTGGDCHLYSNHLEQARLQLSRKPRPLPKLTIRRRPDAIDQYEYEDFEITEYDPHPHIPAPRSEEHTSELQSLMRISYAVFCLKKQITQHQKQTHT